MENGNRNILQFVTDTNGRLVIRRASKKPINLQRVMLIGIDTSDNIVCYDSDNGRNDPATGMILVIKDNEKFILAFDDINAYYCGFKKSNKDDEDEDVFKNEIPLKRLTLYIKHSERSCISVFNEDADYNESFNYRYAITDPLENIFQVYIDSINFFNKEEDNSND